MQKTIVIIGGGASGFMAAITAAEADSTSKIILLEKNREVLGKVRISGGGRCNVTNVEKNPKKFSKNYPRGSAFLLNLFKQFDAQNTIDWFGNKGVSLNDEPDGRMFPITNKSETIVECLIGNARKNKVEIWTSSGAKSIQLIENNENERFEIELFSGEKIKAYSVLYAAGGAPSISGYNILKPFHFQINNPVPSLFTFNIPDSDIEASVRHSIYTLHKIRFPLAGDFFVHFQNVHAQIRAFEDTILNQVVGNLFCHVIVPTVVPAKLSVVPVPVHSGAVAAAEAVPTKADVPIVN